MKSLTLITSIFVAFSFALAGAQLEVPPALDAEQQAYKPAGRRLTLERNQGQFDEAIRFLSRRGLMTVAFTPSAFLIDLSKVTDRKPGEREPFVADGEFIERARVSLEFEGASTAVTVEGVRPLSGRVNYLFGSEPTDWITDVPTFSELLYSGIYPGIDMRVYGGSGAFEYDLILAPQVDPGMVRVQCIGADAIRLEDDGTLLIETAVGPLRQRIPSAYELDEQGGRHEVACRFRLIGDDRFGFDVIRQDPNAVLVIDPDLIYATFLGGSGLELDFGTTGSIDVSVMPDGHAFITGATQSTDFPLVPSGGSLPGSEAVFITKVSPDGDSFVYSTFLGGDAIDRGLGISVDSTGAAYVTGTTTSSNFPIVNGFSSVGGGFVAKLNVSGSGLLYSSRIDVDSCVDVAVDDNNIAVVTGFTFSTTFVTTPGAAQPTHGGIVDAVVLRVDTSKAGAASRVYATFIGGPEEEIPYSIALDPATGIAYVVGRTWTDTLGVNTFPTTPLVFQVAFGGGNSDAFVTAVDTLSTVGSGYVYSTFLGGEEDEEAYGVDLDASGQAYVVGHTMSFFFPTTCGAFDPSFSSADAAFVTVINATAQAIVYSTLLEGDFEGQTWGEAIAVDNSGFVHVAGMTWANDFPTNDPTSDTANIGPLGGQFDVFVVILDPARFNPSPPPPTSPPTPPLRTDPQLVFSTVVQVDTFPWVHLSSLGIDSDEDGKSYVAGFTVSDGFNPPPFVTLAKILQACGSPPVITPAQAAYGGPIVLGWNDAFVMKVNTPPWTDVHNGLAGVSGVPNLVGTGNLQAVSTVTMTLTNAAPAAQSVLFISPFLVCLPFRQGIMVPDPSTLSITFFTDAMGSWTFSAPWTMVPTGTVIYFQAWTNDAVAPAGASGSNAITALQIP